MGDALSVPFILSCIYLILTKSRDFRDFEKYTKFDTRRPKIARKLNTRNLIPFFIFF